MIDLTNIDNQQFFDYYKSLDELKKIEIMFNHLTFDQAMMDDLMSDDEEDEESFIDKVNKYNLQVIQTYDQDIEIFYIDSNYVLVNKEKYDEHIKHFYLDGFFIRSYTDQERDEFLSEIASQLMFDYTKTTLIFIKELGFIYSNS